MTDGERGNPLKQKPPQGRSASGFVLPSTRCVVGWLVSHEGSLAPGGRILLPKKLGALPPGDDLLGSRIAADWECRQLHSAVSWVLLSFVYAGGSCLSTALPPARSSAAVGSEADWPCLHEYHPRWGAVGHGKQSGAQGGSLSPAHRDICRRASTVRYGFDGRTRLDACVCLGYHPAGGATLWCRGGLVGVALVAIGLGRVRLIHDCVWGTPGT